MDNQTRHTLKSDSFVEATNHSVSWLSGHRASVLRWVICAVVVLGAGVAAAIYWNVRTTAADTALGAALDVYNAPVLPAGAPAEKGFYSSAADRDKEANRQFVAIAHDFSWLSAGAKAHYFAGVTFAEMGQTASAETELKAASSASLCGGRNPANLAKLALAGVYHQSGRDGQAVDLYNELIAKPSETVSASSAQLDLADLYAAQGKNDQARALWAKVKDADKDGAAGAIATQKLSGK